MGIAKTMLAGVGKVTAETVMDKGALIELQQPDIVHGPFAPVRVICEKTYGPVAHYMHPTVFSVKAYARFVGMQYRTLQQVLFYVLFIILQRTGTLFLKTRLPDGQVGQAAPRDMVLANELLAARKGKHPVILEVYAK